MSKRLLIIGASGHGKVVADIAHKNGYDEIVFLDDNENITCCGKYPVVGKVDLVKENIGDVFVAIGNSRIRKEIMDKYKDRNYPVLIHPSSVISEDVTIGDGTVIMAGTVINPDSKIGKGAIINTCSSIDHDCCVGDFSHVSVGARLCGTVHVGDSTWIGAGAVVINNIDICDNCVIGAGAVVINNINETGTYVGVPARKI